MSSLPRPLKWPPIFPLEKGLVAWYTFDDRSGAVLRDRSGKGNHGTLIGPTWVAGRRGSALSFDQTNDYVRVADHPTLQFGTDDFFIEVLVKPLVKTTGTWEQSTILEFGAYSVFFQVFRAATALRTYLSDGVSSSDRTTVPSGFAAGLWMILSLGVSRTLDTVFLYQDGWLIDEWDISSITGNLGSGADNVRIGVDHVNLEWFNGVIGAIRILNRLPSVAEIKRHAESELLLARQ
jgi:hypothetical protein